MKKLLACLGLALALTSTGCTLYFGDDDDDVRVSTYCEGSGANTRCYTCYTYPDGWQDCQPNDGGGNGGWGCATDESCAAGCYCEEPSGICVEAGTCRSDADCGAGLVCDECRSSCETPDNTLSSCDPNSCWVTGCPVGFACASDGTCVPSQPPPPPCTSDAECAAGCYCDETTGTCAESSVCTADSQCPAGQTCDEERSTCVPTPPPPPPPACEQIEDWSACIAAQPACTPIVGGTNCRRPDGSSCQPMDTNCTCDTYTFLDCITTAPQP
jgi:Cys-rich repeat protein